MPSPSPSPSGVRVVSVGVSVGVSVRSCRGCGRGGSVNGRLVCHSWQVVQVLTVQGLKIGVFWGVPAVARVFGRLVVFRPFLGRFWGLFGLSVRLSRRDKHPTPMRARV